jgi:hypothetical protein
MQKPVAEAAVLVLCTLWLVDNLAYALPQRFVHANCHGREIGTGNSFASRSLVAL